MPYKNKEARVKCIRDYRVLRKPLRKPFEANANPIEERKLVLRIPLPFSVILVSELEDYIGEN